MTNYIIKEELEKSGLDVIIENSKTSDILDKNNWSYSYSYKASRIFLNEIVKTYPTLNYFIDLHRDSIPKTLSTVKIGDKSYAKILFLIGLENKNHSDNEIITNAINNYLNANYEGISRGIYYKEGKGVNGVYNQDFHKNTILIEIGGEENTLEEVYNTCYVIAEALINYIGDNS